MPIETFAIARNFTERATIDRLVALRERELPSQRRDACIAAGAKLDSGEAANRASAARRRGTLVPEPRGSRP